MTKKRSGILILSLVSWFSCSSALCSDITGAVSDAQGKPVPEAQIEIANARGKLIRLASTNKAGQYCISGLDPGVYVDSVMPPTATGLKGGTIKADLTIEGLTDDWSLSAKTGAISSAHRPGVCDPPALSDLDILLAVGIPGGATATGLGVACGAGELGCGGGGVVSPAASPSL
jgi:hypothetical protein